MLDGERATAGAPFYKEKNIYKIPVAAKYSSDKYMHICVCVYVYIYARDIQYNIIRVSRGCYMGLSI